MPMIITLLIPAGAAILFVQGKIRADLVGTTALILLLLGITRFCSVRPRLPA